MSNYAGQYTINLPESLCVDLFDERTNYAKALMCTTDILYELMSTHYNDNVIKRNRYEE